MWEKETHATKVVGTNRHPKEVIWFLNSVNWVSSFLMGSADHLIYGLVEPLQSVSQSPMKKKVGWGSSYVEANAQLWFLEVERTAPTLHGQISKVIATVLALLSATINWGNWLN
ncbi:hypothetical protein M5689_011414 [Euphorbia peplus]|nr:hypothetical protein M5689_011414 [Euphorbia peplus]